jgi:hypothetical protein
MAGAGYFSLPLCDAESLVPIGKSAFALSLLQ